MDREAVIIQCAGTKRPDAGRMRTVNGEPVYFVDSPAEARRLEPGKHYARPDDESGWGGTWRDRLIALNQSGEAKKTGLLRAHDLYRNEIYRSLCNGVGIDNLFILSAGWGLVRAAFYLPDYDITFSNRAENRFVVRKLQNRRYADYNHVRGEALRPIVVFCGRDYLPLLRTLLDGMETSVTAYFNAEKVGAEYRKFWDMVEFPGGSTNWHYRAAKSYLAQRSGSVS